MPRGVEHLLQVMVQDLDVPREGEPLAVTVPSIVAAMGLTDSVANGTRVRALIEAAAVTERLVKVASRGRPSAFLVPE